MQRREFLAAPAAALAAPSPLPLIFDTDIGADVDDAIALAILARSPEIRLAAVTTVFQNTRSRAQYASRFLAVLQAADVACFAGCPLPLAPRPSSQLFRGSDAKLRQLPLATETPDDNLSAAPPLSPQHAVDFILSATRAPNGPRHILSVGPQTNLALALLKDPTLADRLDTVTLMGYDFRKGIDPYNVGNDLVAARHLLASGIPLRVLPVEIGVDNQMDSEEYERCLQSPCAHMKFLAPSMRRWVEFVRTRPKNPIPGYLPRPYDSLAALTITHPHLFQWKRGTIRLEPGDAAFQTRHSFTEDAAGLHSIVTALDRKKVKALHMERLLACQSV
ncbi:MAG: nucleoside hydrolase [Acidobacteria bacterium]|nr:nucleoside hydrolase [Acidobacteriota bacterium]